MKDSARKAAALARVAEYNPATDSYTGQRPANDPWLDAIVKAGREFWASRGVTIPAVIRLDVADDLSDSREGPLAGIPAARGWQDGSGRIALDATMVRQSLRTARSVRRPTAQRRLALSELASTVLHEMGHTGGLAHAEDEGFMAAVGTKAVVPQETMQVIRKLVPRRRGEKARAGFSSG